ncbi:MAG: hypothetical protein IK052_06920 [Bacteroidales bacterium]|nr:hypothetical protein [Bacteroidales bacterium]
MTQRNYLIVALDTSLTAPGIVFKTLIPAIARSGSITLLTEEHDPSMPLDGIRLIRLHDSTEKWRWAKRKWRWLWCNPRDGRWARKTFKENREVFLSEKYDAIIVLTSNGYYSALNLCKLLKEKLRCPYIIYSVDGMPSPVPWLGKDADVHPKVSRGLNRLCACANLFILSNPMMLEYEKGIVKDFKGTWDYLYTPYRDLPEGFRMVPHEGFNILYAGSLYGLRKIDGLADAFRRFLEIRPDARLIIVGDVWKQHKEYARDLVDEGKIIFKDATLQINDYYAQADCLIDIAADIPDDVFLSSKVICYLPYSLPIIAISGANSPVSQIMGGLQSIMQCSNNSAQILDALVKAQHIKDCSDRKSLLEEFSAGYLCRRFLSLIEAQLS